MEHSYSVTLNDCHFFPVVILDRKDDPDSRDLVLTTQAMVREVVRGKTPPANKKVKPSQNDLTRTVWTLRTSLRKLSLAKDIRIVPLLWIKLDWTFLFATDTRYYLKFTHKKNLLSLNCTKKIIARHCLLLKVVPGRWNRTCKKKNTLQYFWTKLIKLWRYCTSCKNALKVYSVVAAKEFF